MSSLVLLAASRTTFFSPGDENAFFLWLRTIECVGPYYGDGPDLLIPVESKVVNDESLRELLALFWRYNINMGQLKVFETACNRNWFRDHDLLPGIPSS